jgi:cleavage and polyadenylation specificity factor subunit 3
MLRLWLEWLTPSHVFSKVTAYRAGHVLGAAMFMVEIAGLRVLYTGDYSRLADRHLSAADLPELKPDVGE